MLQSLKKLYKNRNRIKVNINELTIKTTYEDYTQRKPFIKNSNMISRFYHNDKEIGYLECILHLNQIGIIRLEPEYRGNHLGDDIVCYARQACKKYNNKDELWCAAMEKHPYWENYKKSEWHKPVHKLFLCGGYRF